MLDQMLSLDLRCEKDSGKIARKIFSRINNIDHFLQMSGNKISTITMNENISSLFKESVYAIHFSDKNLKISEDIDDNTIMLDEYELTLGF